MKRPSYVYHYTTFAGLLGIINNNSLEFHGSRYDSMNDPDDYVFARDILIPKIKASLEEADIPAELKEDWVHYPYIVSFSESEDDSFMWKHYRSNVCLKISTKAIEENSVDDNNHVLYEFKKCSYLEEKEMVPKFPDVYLEMDAFDSVSDGAYITCSFIKRKAFERENEWRMVSCNYDGVTLSRNSDNSIIEQCHEIPDDRVFFEIKDNHIRSYKKFLLPGNALKGIIINEDNFSSFQKTKKQIELLLSRNNMSKVIDDITMTNNYPI